jgi:hypothetical protein
MLIVSVFYLRHKIQKGLLTRDQQPIEAELPEISRFISKLESFGDLDASILRNTKIYKVCKAILKLDNIPGNDTYQFKDRCAALYERYSKILDSSQQPSLTRVISPSQDSNSNILSSPSRRNLDDGEPTEAPAICLTQLTREQCTKIEEAAATFDPPLDRGVVELMCMLPHFTSKYGVHDLQVIPMGRMEQPFDSYPTLDRGVYRGGPIIPPHMLKLTFWVAPGYPTAFFIDTKTGEGLELQHFSPEGQGVRCTEFEGPRRPIEELLQEWIDLSLSIKLVPSGNENILSDGFRSMVSSAVGSPRSYSTC